MKQSIVIRIAAEKIEALSIGTVKAIHVRLRPKLKAPFRAYLYCPQARDPIYSEEDGERRLVYYKDDLAIVHEAFGGISIRNPYGSLGKNDLLLNDSVVGVIEIKKVKRCENGFDLIINPSDTRWFTESPMRIELFTSKPPIVWSYCDIEL